jgi:hypothetical protein
MAIPTPALAREVGSMSKDKPVTREFAMPRDLSGILRDSPAGAWVALSHDKTHIVGTAKSIEAASVQAQFNGESNPVLIKMPLEDEGMAAGVK